MYDLATLAKQNDDYWNQQQLAMDKVIRLALSTLDKYHLKHLSHSIDREYEVRYPKENNIIKRKPIKNKQIFEMLGVKCAMCGSGDNLTIDHIFPLSLGGTDDAENLQVLCKSCNCSKGNRI